MSEHNCVDNLEFLKIKSSDKSLKYQCKICSALFRQTVNQFNHVIQQFKPYKCSGYMTSNNEQIKCNAITTVFSGKNAWCAAHVPRRRIIELKKASAAQARLEKKLDAQNEASYNLATRQTQERVDISTLQYDNCKDNLCGYMEL